MERVRAWACRGEEREPVIGIAEETLTCIFIHGHVYRASSGRLDLGLFSEAGHLGGPPPKMEVFLEGLPRLINFRGR